METKCEADGINRQIISSMLRSLNLRIPSSTYSPPIHAQYMLNITYYFVSYFYMVFRQGMTRDEVGRITYTP